MHARQESASLWVNNTSEEFLRGFRAVRWKAIARYRWVKKCKFTLCRECYFNACVDYCLKVAVTPAQINSLTLLVFEVVVGRKGNKSKPSMSSIRRHKTEATENIGRQPAQPGISNNTGQTAANNVVSSDIRLIASKNAIDALRFVKSMCCCPCVSQRLDQTHGCVATNPCEESRSRFPFGSVFPLEKYRNIRNMTEHFCKPLLEDAGPIRPKERRTKMQSNISLNAEFGRIASTKRCTAHCDLSTQPGRYRSRGIRKGEGDWLIIPERG